MAIAAVTFLGLGLLQLLIAQRYGRFALTVDGVHNLGDAVMLEVLRRSRQRPATKFGLWACRIRPAVPLASCVLAPATATGLQVWTVLDGGVSNVVKGSLAALVLEAVSLGANIGFAKLLPDVHDHGDDEDGDVHVLAAKFELLGDAAAAAVAMLAYGLILAGGAPRWCDIVGGWVGAILVAVFHWRPARRAWRNIQRHREPGHTHLRR